MFIVYTFDIIHEKQHTEISIKTTIIKYTPWVINICIMCIILYKSYSCGNFPRTRLFAGLVHLDVRRKSHLLFQLFSLFAWTFSEIDNVPVDFEKGENFLSVKCCLWAECIWYVNCGPVCIQIAYFNWKEVSPFTFRNNILF